MRARWMAFLLVSATGGGLLAAEPAPRDDVPPALRDWAGWVLAGTEELRCTPAEGQVVCLWPGRLRLDVRDGGADFAFEVTAERRLAVPLPGGDRHWPQDVRVDGRAAPVLVHESQPVVRVERGPHEIAGRFAWSVPPDTLRVPPAVALVELTVAGRTVERPLRGGDGALTLRQHDPGADEPDRLRVQVTRRISDGVPIVVDTAVDLTVAGRAREVDLPGALLPGTAPLAVSGGLPARLLPGGGLRVQVRSGVFTVETRARLEGSPESVAAPRLSAPWPTHEIWALQKDDAFRQLEVEGGRQVEGRHVEMHAPWRGLPAFWLEGGETLRLRSPHRGMGEPRPPSLTVRRTLWLSLDGRTFSVADQVDAIGGTLTRLSMPPPAVLGRVAVGEQTQLVSADPASGLPGVELRSGSGSVFAESRLPRAWRIGAVGWDTDADRLVLQLALPPGWRLLAAPGADEAPNAWTARWGLGGVLAVGLGALLAARLWGRRWALLTGFALVLLWGEPGAPLPWVMAWLGATALLRLPAQGGWRRLTYGVWTAVTAVAVAVSTVFALAHASGALHPQLARADDVIQKANAKTGSGGLGAVAAPPRWQSGTRLETAAIVHEPPVAAWRSAARAVSGAAPVPEPPQQVAFCTASARPTRTDQPQASRAEQVSAGEGVPAGIPTHPPTPSPTPASPVAPTPAHALVDERDPDDLLQAGWGLPTWSWSLDYLLWTGRVPAAHRVWLLLAPPWLNLLLALARVALLTALGLRLLRAGWRPAPTVAASALLVLFVPFVQPRSAAAQVAGFPDEATLDALRERLLEPPDCAPDCVSTARVHFATTSRTLMVSAEVHAGAPVAWPFPGPATSWLPTTVLVDGVNSFALTTLSSQFLAVRLGPGVHRVEAVGPLPRGPALALQLPAPPRLVTLATPGWQVDGLREDGSCAGSLQLSRQAALTAGAARELVVEPFFRVRREVVLGLRWRVLTVAERLTSADAPAVLALPAVTGSVPASEQRLPDGRVALTFGRGVSRAWFEAELPPADGATVELAAPERQPWVEEWVVRPGPLWRCRIDGPPPVGDRDAAGLAYTFRPWPGERIRAQVTRVRGVPGSTIAVRSAELSTVAEARGAESRLELQVAATRAGELTIHLPSGAAFKELRSAGRSLAARPQDGVLAVPVEPGEQRVELCWRDAGAAGWWLPAASVQLDRPAANTLVSLAIPRQRWLVWVTGPAWGPTVPWWPRLLLLLVAAGLVSRLPRTPLALRDWLLLALGLSVLPLAAAVPVAAFLLVLPRWRTRREAPRWQVGVAQSALIVLALVAAAALAGVAWVVVDPATTLTDLLTAPGGVTLRWVADGTGSENVPTAGALALPVWVLRALIVVWSVWLARQIRSWLGWAWECFATGSGWQLDPDCWWRVVVPERPEDGAPSVLGLELGGPRRADDAPEGGS
ncbi:MAG: hypothetical protein AB2L07_02525 [Thermoanaerobaculaceae bacterium]